MREDQLTLTLIYLAALGATDPDKASIINEHIILLGNSRVTNVPQAGGPIVARNWIDFFKKKIKK